MLSLRGMELPALRLRVVVLSKFIAVFSGFEGYYEERALLGRLTPSGVSGCSDQPEPRPQRGLNRLGANA